MLNQISVLLYHGSRQFDGKKKIFLETIFNSYKIVDCKNFRYKVFQKVVFLKPQSTTLQNLIIE